MKDYLTAVSQKFDHPSNVLWKSIELETLKKAIAVESLPRPILDLGCGEGALAGLLFGKGGVDIGIEIDPIEAQKARDSGTYCQVFQCSAQKIPLEDASVGTVYSLVTLHLIPNLDSTLSELFRILKPGGKLIFSVPLEDFSQHLLTSFAPYVDWRNRKLCNHYLYSVRIWEDHLQKNGLKVNDRFGFITPKTLFLWDLIALLMKLFPFLKSFLIGLLPHLLPSLQKSDRFVAMVFSCHKL